jgi:hypothetical protein
MTYTPDCESLREVAIADLGPCIIIVPTATVLVPRQESFSGLAPASRVYSSRGWAFMQGQPIATLEGLRLSPMHPEGAPLPQSPLLIEGVLISFELCSRHPFPAEMVQRARLLYRFEGEAKRHYGLFQNIPPRFVRLYPFRSKGHFLPQIQHFLQVEHRFAHQQSSD